jgi:hypothetical protein
MVEIVPARKVTGRVTGVFAARGGDFVTERVETLALGYDGIPGDRHAGILRKSGVREPWYDRGTEMRNERQLSLLGTEELAEVATALDIDRLAAEWIGGNVEIEGIPHFSLLPPRTILMFQNGVSIRVDGDNGPCRNSGRSIARHFEGREDLEFGFVKQAKRKRGLLGWVERAGTITPGETVTARIWEQWIYPPDQGMLPGI